MADQLFQLQTKAMSREEQRSRSLATRDHAAAQHLPSHSALLARAAPWHVTVPCLDTVYAGMGAVFLGKITAIFLHKSSRLLQRELCTFKIG